VAGALLLFSLAAAAQPHHPGPKRGERHEFRNEIFKLEDSWRNAVMRRDVQAMETLLSDDYIGITSSGMIQSKQQTLDNLRSGVLHFTELAATDRKVRFYGKTAVVTSKAEVKGSSGDGDISGSFRYTRVYVKDEHNAWRIVSFEASRITHDANGES
jgi:ketosteroid isomerase-like protein